MQNVKYVKQVLYKKAFDVRTYALLILQGYVMYLYMKPVVKFSQAVGHKAAPWVFPFILSNLYFVFLFLLGIIYFFSDVPFMQYHNMYQIIRTGRRKWAAGHIAAIMVQSFLIMLFHFLMSVVCLGRYCDYSLDWGKVLHTAALTNAAEQYEFFFSIPYAAMQNFSAVSLNALTLAIGSLVICFFGLLMFAASLFINRTFAIALSAAMAVMVYFVENVHVLDTQRMSMFVPATWLRTANIGLKQFGAHKMPPIPYMFAVLAVGIAVLCALILWKVGRVEFQWNKED